MAKPKKSAEKTGKGSTRKAHSQFPSRDDVIAFVRTQGGDVGTRELARHFGLKNEARAELRHMLRQLSDEGVIARKRHKMRAPDVLPAMLVADITGRDADGELVAVPSEWDELESGLPPKIVIDSSRRMPAGGVGDRALVRIRNPEDKSELYSGRIVRVLDRARPRILGIFRSLPDGGGRMVPVDRKQAGKEIAILPSATKDAQDGDLVAVDLAGGRGHGLPTGRITERLGSIATEKAISLIAINVHDIPCVFPPAALAEADAAQPAILAGREDWRQLPLVTIDPPDAKDHDDAVHAEPDRDPANEGGHLVTVAIADVAYYVRPQSALDREALNRGNSVYFPDRVVPMLPERISNDLCSLKAGEARGALAVRMVIAKDGRKRSHSFHRILMRSAAKLNYAQVQAAVDGRPDDATASLLDDILRPLYQAYTTIKRSRDSRDPLELDLPERKILLKDDGTVDRVITPERLDAHRLIEEFMILANVAAAEELEKLRIPLIYRVHDEPTLEKISALRVFLQTLDISLPKAGALRPAMFNRLLAHVKGRDAEPLVNEMILRSQAQAEYAAENYGHFGLNLRRYAHFTSPIRRYADLIVHRALIQALNLGDGALPEQETLETLGEVAAKISLTERRAMRAERETTDRLIAHYLADRVGAEFHGRISGVTGAGLFIKLTDTGADGLVPIRSLGTEYFRFDEAHQALIGSNSGLVYRLGDPVEVRLVEAAPVAGALRFEIVGGNPTQKSVRRFPISTKGRTVKKSKKDKTESKRRKKQKGKSATRKTHGKRGRGK